MKLSINFLKEIIHQGISHPTFADSAHFSYCIFKKLQGKRSIDFREFLMALSLINFTIVLEMEFQSFLGNSNFQQPKNNQIIKTSLKDKASDQNNLSWTTLTRIS